jgi:hypothetical protein
MEKLNFAEVTLIKVSVRDEGHLHLDVSVEGKCAENTDRLLHRPPSNVCGTVL